MISGRTPLPLATTLLFFLVLIHVHLTILVLLCARHAAVRIRALASVTPLFRRQAERIYPLAFSRAMLCPCDAALRLPCAFFP